MKKTLMSQACGLLLENLARLRERIERNEVSTYKEMIDRKTEQEAGKLEACQKTVEKDIARMGIIIEGEKVRENAEFIRQLTSVLTHLESCSLYYQGMAEICAPVVYAGVKEEEPEERTKESCFLLLEAFTLPLVDKEMERYIEYEKIMRNLPGYRTKYPDIPNEEIWDFYVEGDSVLLWFSRYFEFKDLVKIYAFLMNEPIYAPFLFFIAAIDEIREKQKACRFSEEKSDKKRPSVEEYVKTAKTLTSEYKSEFENRRRTDTLVVFGVVSVAVGMAAAIYMALDRKK